jgi:site-specific DNA-methyltransferase (adenine-specific)
LACSGGRYNNHPTEKPVRLAERILALISDPDDTIYDLFIGSGRTNSGGFGVACINTGRKYISSEMKSEYFDIVCKQVKEAVEKRKFHLNYIECAFMYLLV